ncbi:PTS glucitol/sorbitol transporter subunit IIA [Vibrio mediterranei]|uniref:PTS glucitol/sorbitol transporter subunit IIA n=1 Tax=Vibrio mediterranei TaxID=689 RepID=UPI00148BB19B|nr:PTS glucitol/sorbitol transporter subunit IIA [Vibrio mediterranei]NOH29819.1 PTS sorbitol transporter subunit IIA [Vibrio mediterranei]
MGYQFRANIVSVGEFAQEALQDDMLILFNDSAPDDVADYCFIHDQAEYSGELSTESTLLIDDEPYVVTSVGSAANTNLKNLGHITIKFDGSLTPDLAGTVHVIGRKKPQLESGVSLIFG